MYGHPNVKYPTRLKPDSIVEHKYLPGIPLVIVSGPEKGPSGDRYRVKKPSGEVCSVIKRNLII